MYLAANLNNPIVGPFLVYAEIQAGSLLRRGSLYPLSFKALGEVRLADCLVDLALGSILVGVALGVLAGLAAYTVLREGDEERFRKLLIARAALRYLDSGYAQWEFVRGKLRFDPVYLHLVRSGVLPSRGRLLDLGSGRGILLSLLVAYRDLVATVPPPHGWPPPPELELVGVEGRRRVAAIARRALGSRAKVRWVDLHRVDLPPCDGVVLLDVLHYLDRETQEELLQRARLALEEGGVVVVREADAGAGIRFAATRVAERLRSLQRGRPWGRFAYRRAAEWQSLLEGYGLEVRAEPCRRGTPFANVLLVARAAPLPSPPTPA
jgi:SAM-dependent methyltransferase